MKTITLESGFRRHATLVRAKAEEGEWEIVDRSSPNTYAGDGDSTKTVELPHGFQGAIVWHWDGESNAELIGFTDEELASPAPEGVVIQTAPNWEDERWEIPQNRGAYLRAHVTGDARTIAQLVAGRRRLLMEDLGYAVEIPYIWGHQNSAAFIVFPSDGKPYIVSGTGDSSPYYLAEEGRLTSEREEIEREEFERAL